MTEEFFAQNNLNPRMSFNERAMYKEFALQTYDDLDLTDFLYGSPFYGKLDRKGNAIIPNENFLEQYEAKSTCFGINFVVDAFEAFKVSFLLDLESKAGIANYGSRYVQLAPSRAWRSVHTDYYDYQVDIYNAFRNDFFASKALRKKVCSFKKFLEYYFRSLGRVARNNPVTKIAFVKSNLSSPAISGLTLDLYDQFTADDDLVKQPFLEDNLLDLFIRNAIKHGFSIDVNVPWRMVARLDSPEMKKFLSSRGLKLENLFDQVYNKIYPTEYADFKLTATEYYNTLVSDYAEEDFPDYNKQGKMFIRKLKRNYVTGLDASNISETYWLKKYFLIRQIENGKIMNSRETRRQDKEINSLYGKYGTEAVLEVMEQRLLALPPSAFPSYRRTKFDYGTLNPETNLYTAPNIPKSATDPFKAY
jgi:hypothetical protein